MNQENKATILVIDDEIGVQQSFKMALKLDYNVILAGTGKEAIERLTRNSIDLILLDIRLPDTDGTELLKELKDIDPKAEVIMITAVKDIHTAVKTIKLGAYEYVSKPFNVEEVMALIERALEKRSLVKEVVYLRDELDRHNPFEKIVGEDPAMKNIFETITTIAESDGAVLIQGESGTGKELVARAIHNLSPRKNEPFVVVNCAAIPPTLMESKIFGHHKGAFTGATRTAEGKLEIADKGSVFLDDIDTLDISMQAKLLRAIQEKEFEYLGSTKVIKVDVRFIAASNQNIGDLIAENKFREDLFYRLNVFPIKLPPLRQKKSDIPLLLNHFLNLNSKKTGKPPKRFSKKAIKNLMNYEWPGNVRELQNLVERSFTVAKDSAINMKDVYIYEIKKIPMKDMALKEAVQNFEKRYIVEILSRFDGNRKKTSEILGIHRNTLASKLNELEDEN